MTLDSIERNGLEQNGITIGPKLDSLNKGFMSSVKPEGGLYVNTEMTGGENALSSDLMLDGIKMTPKLRAETLTSVRNMYHGTDVDGRHTLSLKEIHAWKINPKFSEQNFSQHAGFAAEVIGTEKENLISKAKGNDSRTFRVDDMPDSLREQFGDRFARKNDQYVDKIRIDNQGNVETVQTKFVGDSAESCFKKLQLKKFDKYINDDQVDKLEIPKDYYDEIKQKHIPKKREKLQGQLDRMKSDGNAEKVTELESKIDRLDRLDKMLEKSTVTSDEAIFAVKHPKMYAAKLAAARANQAGLSQAKQAAGLTAVISGVDNFQQYYDGEISGTEAIGNVAKDTAVAGGVGYVTGAITDLSHSSVPAMAISMGIESYGDIKDFADGEKSGGRLVYDLGENAAKVVGGAVGAAAGTAAGSIAGPVGSFAGGLAGGAVGSELGAKNYEYTVENISDTVDDLQGYINGEISGSDLAYDLGENTFKAMGGVIAGDAAAKAYGASVEFVSDHIGDVAEVGGDVIESIGETTTDMIDNASDIASDVADSVKDTAGDIKDSVSDTFGSIKDKISGAGDK